MNPATGRGGESAALREFGAVDDAADAPEQFVACLDAIEMVPATQAWRRRILEYLRLESGNVVLEVGCGAGEMARVLATIVGSEGRVIAIDKSTAMLEQARERTPAEIAERIEYRVGDVNSLEITNGSIDAIVAERVFVHLDDRHCAMAELVRVAKPGARIVLNDPDMQTAMISSAVGGVGRDVARRISDFWCDTCVKNGWSGRENAEIMARAGLVDIEIGVDSTLVRDLATANAIMLLRGRLDDAVIDGCVSAEEGEHWWAGLVELDAMGAIVASAGLFTTGGRKP